jgi:hypothetical protein
MVRNHWMDMISGKQLGTVKHFYLKLRGSRVMVFNATFNNISIIS